MIMRSAIRLFLAVPRLNLRSQDRLQFTSSFSRLTRMRFIDNHRVFALGDCFLPFARLFLLFVRCVLGAFRTRDVQ